jgi:hypothetical protein
MLNLPLLLPLFLSVSIGPAAGRSQTVEIPASADTTLIEDPEGDLANGSGPVFHAGHTSQPQNGLRRGLVRFDVAAHVPTDAIVESATLSLHCSQTNGGSAAVSLHRVLAPWGEGASSTSGGSGAPAAPGDATWLYASFADVVWPVAGGLFDPRPSAVALVDQPGAYQWSATRRLVQDVRLWLVAPARNRGWLLLGDESQVTTTKRFDSRENPDAALRPVLRVTWRMPGSN